MSTLKYLDFYGSLYACPYGSRLPDCPVKPLERKPFEERYEWFENLPDKEKISIVLHHKQCSEKRDRHTK